MTIPPVRQIRGVIDQNDLGYIRTLGINPTGAEPCPLGGKGVINPHATRFYHDGKVTDVFHIKPIYYEALDHSWRPMGEVTSYHGNRNIVLKTDWAQKMTLRYFRWLMNRQRLFKDAELLIDGYVLQPRHMVFATDSTFYPNADADSGKTTFDGRAYIYGAGNKTWSAIRTEASNGMSDSQASAYASTLASGSSSNTWGSMTRSFYLFDTSAIPDTDTISAATMSIKGTGGKEDNIGLSWNLAVATTASNTDVSAGDYANSASASTLLSDTSISTTSWSESAYNDYALNASGIANISKTGISKFCLRSVSDINNSAPTWVSAGNAGVVGIYADTASTTSDPKLAVTHAAGGGGTTVIPPQIITW